MQHLFLCYRREGAQTAKLLSFYMRRNHPEIQVWYSDKETESNYALNAAELLRSSYGVVIFLSRNFTKGFLDAGGKINTRTFRGKLCEECVTVQEIIEIERNLQTRKDFELHIVNLDEARLSISEQKTLESVFRQAGILQPDSVAHFAQRNFNPFHTAYEAEDAFFDRMIASYLPNATASLVRGNFFVGAYSTKVDVLCWDYKRFIDPRNITFSLSVADTPLYDRIEMTPLRTAPLAQDDDVLAVAQFEQGLTTNEESKYLHIECKICKYHLFKKALDLWDRNGFCMSREIAQYLNAQEEQRVYPIPNAMGLALMVITADHKLVFSRRSSKRRVRSGQFDCSIVEGLLPEVKKAVGGKEADYGFTTPGYIEKECVRAFCEEICADSRLEAQIYGLILDREYGQWNFIGAIRTALTFSEIQARHATRDDTTETNWLYPVDYLDAAGNRSLAAVRDALMLFKKDGFWDTALTVLCGTLLALGFTQEEVNGLI